MDGEVSKRFDEVEARRGEVQRLKRHLGELVDDAMQLTSARGLWARITGTIEDDVKRAEGAVAEVRAALATAEQALAEAEARLAEARQTARAEAKPTAPVSTAKGDVSDRLRAIQDLESITRRLVETGRSLQPRSQRAQGAVGSLWTGGRTGLDALTAGAHDAMLGSLLESWHADVDAYEGLAGLVGVEIRLPRAQPGRSASAELREYGRLERGRRPDTPDGLERFAASIGEALVELEASLEQLREAHRELRRQGVDSAPPVESDKAAVLTALETTWTRLIDLARQLDERAATSTRTSDLLDLLGAWNREAPAAVELAKRAGLPTPLPINRGGELSEFLDAVREAAVSLQKRLKLLRSRTG